MKTATRLVLAAVLLVGGTVGIGNAQVLDKMTFKTDFPFVAGNTTLPAGAYTITPVDDDPMLLELSNGKVTVLLDTVGDNTTPAPSKDEVTFNKYGDTYVLHAIRDAGSQGGAEMIPMRAEKRHEKAHGTPTQHKVGTTNTSKP